MSTHDPILPHRSALTPAPRKRASRKGGRHRIAITYDIVTEESAAVGDFAETGWVNKAGVSMKPDKYDKEEGLTVVDMAVKFLKDEGAMEPSSTSFHPRVWYSWPDAQQNYSTGDYTTQAYHLKGFTEEEERAVFNAVKPKGW